jgi:hypothetical protein
VTTQPRTVVVGSLVPTKFQFIVGDPYTRDANNAFAVNPPATQAISIDGEVTVALGSPALSVKKWRWGIVQSVKGTENCVMTYVPPPHWDALTSAPVSVTFPKTLISQSVPNALCDTGTPGSNFYDGPWPFVLDHTITDTPTTAPRGGTGTKNYRDSKGYLAEIVYTLQDDQQLNLTFVDWLAVVNIETGQFVPIQQGGWILSWDTSVKANNKWSAVVNSLPANPSSKLVGPFPNSQPTTETTPGPLISVPK